MTPLRTERLILRSWRDTDRRPWAELNADTVVMAHFPATLSRSESDAMVDRMQADLDDRGWGWVAIERRQDGAFVGGAALVPVNFDSWFTPAVEVGWRLTHRHWGHGYATEAARALLRYGFDELALDEVVSFTAAANRRSEAVMVRLGFVPHADGATFEHPNLAPGHPLRRHVLYHLQRTRHRRAEQV